MYITYQDLCNCFIKHQKKCKKHRKNSKNILFDLNKRRIMDFGKTIEQNKSVLSIFWK
ncbi:hypothetical protein CLOBOL_04456 [Enterocloster bolteae ATCC BAA-613]|uniref:Uncharacterized protein n=1 Tax=Enterocloster bolteae (strain ATCC BAA-613 / DSM 15670 / CCUG 46953 / JCM 12243 / WAL 16351) TaxID=411902 RepID=A8RW21_ENTBW|nr:hypothetical protein CLOBOL_04456 [Enterocloster bolteae ATCC BAA-613]